MADLELILTADGSHSLRNTALLETYHSVHGAVRESQHVFIMHGLKSLDPALTTIRILEVGFGTALNALLTAIHASENATPVHYTAIEPFPLAASVWQQLNYPSLLHTDIATGLFADLHDASWEKEAFITNNFTLVKKKLKMEEWRPEGTSFDLVFFDAFAPAKQPEMWELPILKKVCEAMNPGAVFVTYCARGQLKRDLKSLGMAVQTLPGPPGKKEMVRAVKS